MITADPQQRIATLQHVLEILDRTAAQDDRELLRAFAPVVYAQLPDSLALRLSAESLAARIRRYFEFVAQTSRRLPDWRKPGISFSSSLASACVSGRACRCEAISSTSVRRKS